MDEKIKKTKVIFVGIGGQGVLLATKILGDAFTKKGIYSAMSEIHGMAQRGGIVECSIVWGGEIPKGTDPTHLLKANQTFYSPTIGTGEADIGVGFELLEAYRSQHYYSPSTIVLINTRKIEPPMVSMGYGTYPEPSNMIEELRSKVRLLIELKASEIAIRAGTERATNIVMLGALWRTGLIPLTEEELWDAIEQNISKKVIEVNKIAFKNGIKAIEDLIQRGEISL